MRKKRLLRITFVVVCAIMGLLFPTKVVAQGWSDITSSKLTNADLSSLDGWTTATNISGENHDTGLYVRESFHQTGWGLNRPTIELTQDITLSAGKYVLTGNAFHRGSGTGNLYVKVGSSEAQTVALPLVGNGEYKNVADNMANAAKTFKTNSYLSVLEFEVSSNNTSVTVGYTGTATADYDWFIAGPISLYEVKNEISSTYPLDLTNTINRGYEGWTYVGSQDMGNTYFADIATHQTYKSSALDAGNVISRSYSGLGHGVYEVEVFAQGNCAWGASSVPATAPEVFANSVSTAATCVEQNTCSSVPKYTLSNVDVTSGSLNIGFRNTASGGNWYLFNLKSLKMTDPCLDFIAEELPASGDMVAGQWYYTDIAIAGSDYNATATTLGNIVYTTNGLTLKSNENNITSQFTATGNSLSATRYYVKSSSTNSLAIQAAAYTYTVGSATSSHAYVQGGETVTITYADAITNNGNATFGINGTPSITFNSSAVTVTPTSNGFTFEVPSGLTANTSYTLAIPADAFGYAAGSTYNTAQNITFKTPALFDQTGFLKDNSSGLFLARGLTWGTRAYLDEYGIATQIATDADGYTSITFVDTDRKLGYDDSNNLWCDKGGSGDDTKWTVTLNDGKYRLTGKSKTAGTDFVKYDQSDDSRNLWANITNAAGENIIGWTLVSASDYADEMTALKNSQASTAATAAGTSAATPDALASAVSGWNKTKVITGSTPTAAAEKFKQGQTNPAPITIVSNEVTITTPGLYKFSMQAFYRMRGNAENYTLHTQGFDSPAAYVFFGNAKTQIASVFDHAESSAYSNQDYANSNNHYPNGMVSALAAFQNENYINTIWTYISQSDIDAATDGKFTYGIKYEGWPNYISGWNNGNAQLGVDQWCCWTVESVDLTLYSQDLWPSLQAALTTYAPYSDIAAGDDATGYTTQYNVYEAYTEQTSQSDMLAAINYMQENYANYQWANASIAHPVDVTEDIIRGWECTANDAWPGSGRTTATGTYYDGTNRTYFTQNHENGAARSQAVTIPEIGAYLLRTIVRPVAAASYATISVGSESTTTRGIQTGTTNIGNDWAYNDVYFATTSADESKTISIALSNVNNSREADCGEMHLLYIGQNADFVKDGVHKYIGTYETAPALEVTDAVPVADVTGATFTSGSSIVTFTNPNGLVFVASDGQTSAAKNEVIGTTCASLQLEKGHPFINPKEFTATAAKYTMVAGELAGGSFATLMIPFAASTLAGTAYALDQDINLIDGNIHGTVASSIAANSPVLVTASGEYSGSNVTVPVVAAGATYTNVELVGTYTTISAPTNSYVLQNHTSGEGVAFYLVGSTQPTVNPFRAYIKAQASNVRALQFLFDDETDGIHSMDNGQWSMDNAAIYNISGQRVSKPTKGLYIVNGKKVMIK